MIIANQKRIEVVTSPPCAEFRPRFNARTSFAGSVAKQQDLSAEDTRSRLAPIAVFILSAVLVAFATNLSMHLLNLRMQKLGLSEFGIGLSVATQALGIILAAPLTKNVVASFGIRQTFVLGASIASATLIVFSFLSDFLLLGALRLIFAIGLALLFTVSESLVITRTNATNRGRVVGWYATSLAVGTASGSAFVAVIGIDGFTPLLWAAFFFWLTTVPAILYIKKGQELSPVVRSTTFAALRIIPVAFLSAFIFGVVDNGGMSMLSVYSTLNGYSYSQAALIASVATMGGIVLQIPLGYSANNRDPQVILLLCGVFSIFLLTLLPNVMSIPTAAMGVSFGLGGFLGGLYTVGLFCIAKYGRNVGIASANGCFVSMCGFGEFVGPLSTGTSIEYLGSNGFVVGLVVMLVVYILLMGFLKQNTDAQLVREY